MTIVRKESQKLIGKVDFRDIKFPVKVRDIYKTEKKKKKNFIDISTFGYEKKEKDPISASNICFEEKHDLLYIAEKGNRLYVLIKDFNTFMCNHTLHIGRKYFCRYC